MPALRRRNAHTQRPALPPGPRRRSATGWFYGGLGLVLLFGVLGAAFLKPDSSAANLPPEPADPTTGAPGSHWHTAFGVNICGQWLANPPTFETAADNPNVRVGIHTHGDGYIHIHPYTRSEGGNHATVGLFFSYGGWSVSSDSIDAWSGPGPDPQNKSWSNGERCPPGTPDAGRSGVLRWSIDCKERTGNPADYKLRDQQILVIAFIPRPDPIPVTPNAAVTPFTDGIAADSVATSACKPAPVVPDTSLVPSTSVPPSITPPGSAPSP